MMFLFSTSSGDVYAGDGDDVINGGDGHDILDGGAGNDILIGGVEWGESIDGGEGSDTLTGSNGDDTVNGGDGDDTYVVGSLGDVIIETSGTDTVRSSITLTLGDGLENLQLLGLLDISGTGNAASNEIIGNAGDNLLDGRGGADVLTGGRGEDGFVISRNDGSIDLINDFTANEDMVLIDAVEFGLFDLTTLTGYTQGTGSSSNFATVTNGVSSNADAQFVFNLDTRILSVDDDLQDSTAARDVVALSDNAADLTATDLYVLL